MVPKIFIVYGHCIGQSNFDDPGQTVHNTSCSWGCHKLNDAQLTAHTVPLMNAEGRVDKSHPLHGRDN